MRHFCVARKLLRFSGSGSCEYDIRQPRYESQFDFEVHIRDLDTGRSVTNAIGEIAGRIYGDYLPDVPPEKIQWRSTDSYGHVAQVVFGEWIACDGEDGEMEALWPTWSHVEMNHNGGAK